jgi:hypothetical protein
MSRTWFSFSWLLCDEIQTLYVIGCKVTTITGSETPFPVYVSVKMLTNLVTAALTEITYVLRAIYQQGNAYSLSSKAAKLVHSSSVRAAVNTAQFDLLFYYASAMRLCLAVNRSKAGTLSVHLVIQVSADVGIQGHMLSSITNSLREEKNIYR